MRTHSFSYKSFFLIQNIHWECKYFWVGEMEDNLLNWYLIKNTLGMKVGIGRDSVKSMIVEGGRRDVDLKKQSVSHLNSCLAYLWEREGMHTVWYFHITKAPAGTGEEMLPQVTLNDRIYCISLSVIRKLFLLFTFSHSERLYGFFFVGGDSWTLMI